YDEVGAGLAGHLPSVVLGAPLGDEVEHHVGAAAVGQLPDRVDLAAVGEHGVVRAQLLGELERIGVAVHNDDPGGGERRQPLDADVAEAARADHYAARAPP